MRVKKAVIPCAGKATRWTPISKYLNKAMLPIGTKPAIYYIMEECLDAGISDVYIILPPFNTPSASLASYLQQEYSEYINITYIKQNEASGLGDAILQAEDYVGEDPFAVVLPDEFFLKPQLKILCDLFVDLETPIIGTFKSTPEAIADRYGWCNDYNIILEKPSKEEITGLRPKAVSGRYVFTSEIFTWLAEQEKGINGEYQLSDAINFLGEVSSVDLESKRFDTGTVSGWLEANNYITNRNNKALEES